MNPTANGVNPKAPPENALHQFLHWHLPLIPLIKRVHATGWLQHSALLTYIGMIVYFMQLVGFVINPHFNWGVIISTGLDQAIFASHIPAYDSVFSSTVTSTGLQVVLWVTTGLLLAAMLPVMYRKREASASPVEGLAGVAADDKTRNVSSFDSALTYFHGVLFRSTATWLIVPMAHWCCAAWACRDGVVAVTRSYVQEAPTTCYTGGHIAAICAAIGLSLLSLPVICAFTSVDADVNPLSRHPKARAHTNVDFWAVLQLLVVTALFHVGVDHHALAVPAAALFITSTAMTCLVGYSIPYYDHTTNRIYCSIHTTAAVVGLVGFFAAIFADPSTGRGRAPTTILISSFPLAMVLGWCVPDVRIATRWQQLLVACDQGLDVAEDPRDTAALEDMMQFDRMSRSVPSMHIIGLDDNTPWLITDDELEMIREGGAANRKSNNDPTDMFLDDPDDHISHDSSASSGSHGGGKPQGDPDAARKRRIEIQQLVSRTSAVIKNCHASPYITTVRVSADVELATRFITGFRRKFSLPAPQNLRDACASVFNRGLIKFCTSALVPVHFAQFVASSDNSRCTIALEVLESVKMLDPSVFDIVRASELRQELRVALGILDHTYERHMSHASELHTDALRRMHAFWLKLMEPSVDLASAAEVADDLHVVRREALDRFRQALESQRGSIDVDFARRLGHFMSEVMLDNGAATECEAVATELSKRIGKRRNGVDAEMATRVARLSAVIGDEDEAENSNAGGSGSDRARKTSLMQHMTAVFAALLVCVAALIGISVLTRSIDHVLTDRIVNANRLRTIPFQASYTIAEYRNEILANGAVTQRSSALTSRLLDMVSTMENSLRSVVEDTSGATAYVAMNERASLSAQIQLTVGPTGRIASTSLWVTLSTTIDEIRRVAIAANATQLFTVATTLAHLQAHSTSTSAETLSRHIAVWLEEHANVQQVSTAVSVLIVLCGIGIALLAVAALLHNFRVAAETKFLTFQLFTLIPFDSLELLATATKTRVDDRVASSRSTTAGRGGAGGDGEDQKHSSDDDIFDDPVPPVETAAAAGVPPAAGAAGAAVKGTDSSPNTPRTMSVTDAVDRKHSVALTEDTRRSSGSKKPLKGWRGMLHVALRGGSVKGILKSEPKPAAGPAGPRVRLNPEVQVVEPPASAEEEGKLAMTGKAAIHMIIAMQKSQTSSTPQAEASASSISLAEKTGELDLEAIKAGEQWRTSNNVYPTKVVGSASTRKDALRSDDAGEGTWRYFFTVRVSSASRVVAYTAFIGAAVAFLVAVPTVLRAADGVTKLELVDSAIEAVSRHHLKQSFAAASYVFSVTPVAEFASEFQKAFRSYCGINLVAEPLFNCTTTSESMDRVVAYVDAYVKLTAVQSDAVLLANFAYSNLVIAPTPQSISFQIGSLENASSTLRRYANLHQSISDAARLTAVAAQSGTTNTDLGALVVEASRRILKSPTVVQYSVAARSALRDAAVFLKRTSCDHALESVRAGVALQVALWLAVAALIAETINTVLAQGRADGPNAWRITRQVIGLSVMATCVGLYAAVYNSNTAVEKALQLSCATVDASTQMSIKRLVTLSSVQHFVESSDRGSWAAYRSLLLTPETAGVLDAARDLADYLSPFTNSQIEAGFALTDVYAYRIALLQRIAVTLAWLGRQAPVATFTSTALGLQYTDAAVIGDPTTTAFVQSTTWNAKDDAAAAFDVDTFYGSNPLATFTNRTFDLNRWTASQAVATAIELVHDARFEYYVDSYAQAALSAKTLLRQAWVGFASKTMENRFRLAIAAIVVTAASMLLLFLILIPALVRDIKGSADSILGGANDDKNSSAMERIRSAPAFRIAIQKSYLAVSIIMVLLLAALGVAVYEARANNAVPQFLEAAGLRSTLIAQSYAALLRSSDAVFDSNACAIRAVEEVTVSGNDAFINFGDASLGALGMATTSDTINFGPVSNTNYESDAAAFVTSQCGIVSQPSSLRTYGPFGSLPTTPLQIALRSWRASVIEYLSPSTTDSRKAALLTSLQDSVESIVATSLASDAAIASAADSRDANAAVALYAICAVIIATVLFLYQWLVIPLSSQLVRMQHDTLLMLQVVPPEVRDLVPAITEYMETGTMDTAAEIRRKLEMNESLLKNILPESISRRLKSGESPIADMHPSITIVFTDFVGFTSISSGLSAEEIVDFLNEVFVEFDLISEMLKLDKIKTIGDAYFMTGGLDPKITDHAMRVIEASIFMFEALSDHNAKHRDRKPLRMRLGVHTGPAIAGVIGTKKVAYDLWGPNVGIANGMEASGVPGRIHISDATLAHVRGYYAFESRGELPREKGVPDVMPSATFLFTGRLVPTPYQFMRRPRNDPRQQQQVQAQRAAAAAAAQTAAAANAAA